MKLIGAILPDLLRAIADEVERSHAHCEWREWPDAMTTPGQVTDAEGEEDPSIGQARQGGGETTARDVTIIGLDMDSPAHESPVRAISRPVVVIRPHRHVSVRWLRNAGIDAPSEILQ